jgi:Reverse transcriptase (RNA-dependent DNA polymerase).
MASPISSTIAEVFIKHFENFYIKHILDDKNTRYYTRYVDDVLIIYDNNKTNSESITQQINKIHNDMRFNPTHEANNRINFLDLQVIRNTHKFEIDLYIRKPHDYRHHYQLHIIPTYVTQNSGIQILHLQNAFSTIKS